MRNQVIFAFLLTLGLIQQSYADEPPVYHVIVNAKNPVDSLDRRFLADVFFKRLKRWPEDGAIMPVDLAPDAIARRAFSDEILGRTVAGVKNYWQQLIFSGQDVPPPEFKSEDEVLEYITDNPNAIGYVSGAAVENDVDHSIKSIIVK